MRLPKDIDILVEESGAGSGALRAFYRVDLLPSLDPVLP